MSPLEWMQMGDLRILTLMCNLRQATKGKVEVRCPMQSGVDATLTAA